MIPCIVFESLKHLKIKLPKHTVIAITAIVFFLNLLTPVLGLLFGAVTYFLMTAIESIIKKNA
jgi:hypothetical protein